MVRQSVFDDIGPNAMVQGTAVGAAPEVPSAGAAPAVGAPSLPENNPTAPPPVAEPVSGSPDNADITALRSAQLRLKKQQRGGRLFGRSLLAFVLIGGMLAAGLFFGRSLLFPTAWDSQMTPIVNEIQDSTGLEFETPVPFVVISADEYSARLGSTAVGTEWTARVPQWRALGLAAGDVDDSSVGEAVGATMAESATAFYDPSNRTIYRSNAVLASDDDLRAALVEALDGQQAIADASVEATADADADASVEPVVEPIAVTPPVGDVVGFTGVSPMAEIAARAVDQLLVDGGVDARQPAPTSLPIPIAYEIAAIDLLGGPIVTSAGVDPSSFEIGGPYPPSVTDALDDDPVETASALLQPGEVSIVAPVALGRDDWSLVWGVGLPQSTVAGLIDQVTADSYRAVERNGTICVLGIFQTVDEAAGANVMAAMTTWAANAPDAANAVATQLTATRVQLESCDPGADAPFAANGGVVDALLDRQQLRLSN